MTSVLRSIYNRSTSYFSPASSSSSLDLPSGDRDDYTVNKVPTATALFPTVTATDAECLQDCATCTIRYPSRFSIDETDELYGRVNGWSTHILVATGKTDWVRDVSDEKGSVMEAIGKGFGGIKPRNGKLMLSASNMPPPDEYHHAPEGEQPTTVLVLPAFTLVHYVKPSDVEELVERFIETSPTTTSPLSAPLPAPPLSRPPSLSSRPCPHKYIILLCSQKTRDARCGQSAPLLRKEFERHLRPLGLYRDLDDERPGGVGIYFISHVGGHKYSANVMIYRRSDSEGPREPAHENQELTAPVLPVLRSELVEPAPHVGTGERSAEEEGRPRSSDRPDELKGAQPADIKANDPEQDERKSPIEQNGTVVLPLTTTHTPSEPDPRPLPTIYREPPPHNPATSATQAIWLARVRPEDCEGIIKYTVLQGKVVKPERQLRGGWDRERGVISW